MLITRTPLRITLGGGGTDLPSYYEQHEGLVISAAINKYVYIAINRTFTEDYFLKYSALERRERIDDIEHPIIREVLRLHPIGPYVELVSLSDIPAGTGLGSSGSFTVGLLRAVYAYNREHATVAALADEACRIEIDVLRRPVGKQDQYIAAFGGLTCLQIAKDGYVQASPLMITNETLHDLEEHLLMFFTGYSRQADEVLEDQKTRSVAGDREMLENLHVTKEIGLQVKEALERGDTAGFGELMREHWRHKRKRSPSVTNAKIDRWHDVGIQHGALGGKLVGAGAGGFLLFYAKDTDRLRQAMSAEGLKEVRFAFDLEGTTVAIRD